MEIKTRKEETNILSTEDNTVTVIEVYAWPQASWQSDQKENTVSYIMPMKESIQMHQG